MPEPLDPISAVSFDKYYLYQDSLNITQIVKLNCQLNYELLIHALKLVMEKHPVLRSRVKMDLSSPWRFFWEELDNIQTWPIELEHLNCEYNRLETEIIAVENKHHNENLQVDKDYPFKLFVTLYSDNWTHLQLVLSHVVADGISMSIFFRDLLQFYIYLEQGKLPKFEPLPYPPADWKNVFAYSVDSKLKNLIQRPVQVDLRRKKTRNEPYYGDERDWPTLAAVFRKNQTDREPIMTPFPRSVCQDNQPVKSRFQRMTRMLHYTFAPKRLQALQTLAQSFRFKCSIYDILNAAYLQSQLEMARLARENVQAVKFGVPVDMRQFCPDATVKSCIGNMATAIFFTINLTKDLTDNIEQLVQAINLYKRLELQKMPQTALSRIYSRYALAEPVPSASWDSFIKIVGSENLETGRFLHTSNLGVIDAYFEDLSDLKISQIKTGNTPRRVMSIMMLHCFRQSLSISCTYLPELTNAEEVRKTWHLFIRRIDFLASELEESRYDQLSSEEL